DKVPEFQYQEETTKTKFSVVIPFRNEANNLPVLLNSITNLEYPVSHFELIFINDESEDTSVEIIEKHLNNSSIDYKILQNKRFSKSPKKDAISGAIEIASYEWIITTDADCLLPKYWLTCFSNFIHKTDCSLIAAPVTYYNIQSFLDKFQTLDFLSLIGATIEGFGLKKSFMSNVANLAYKKYLVYRGSNVTYKKDSFKTLNVIKENNDTTSGDDVFLLHNAIEKHPKSVLFLKAKEAIVLTRPQPDFVSLKSQRIRWASKTTNYKNTFGKLTGLVVFLMNSTLIASMVFIGIGIFDVTYLIFVFSLKLTIDFILLFKTASFFNLKQLFGSYLLCAFFYPFFSVYIATLSIFSNYKWKDRAYKT